MDIFEKKFSEFINEFGQGRTMVLASSYRDRVSSRMMSVVLVEGKFYFQTDKNFRKYEQIRKNANVALCMDNIQIEGLCREIGKPSNHKAFLEAYKKSFNSSYKKYSHLENERLFEITPTYIQRWQYVEGLPYIERFDMADGKYSIEEYII